MKRTDIDFRPRYNIAPTQNILIVTSDGHDNHLNQTAKWGLIPHWAKDSNVGSHMINARAETLSEKPSFKGLLKSHRCIVVADGFYEWKHEGKIKRPMYITLKDRHPFGFAGLYSLWKDQAGEEIMTCTIITTAANDLVESIHDRMPVILSKQDEELWLQSDRRYIGITASSAKTLSVKRNEVLRSLSSS